MDSTKIQIPLKGLFYVFVVSLVFFTVLCMFVFVNVTTRRNLPQPQCVSMVLS